MQTNKQKNQKKQTKIKQKQIPYQQQNNSKAP